MKSKLKVSSDIKPIPGCKACTEGRLYRCDLAKATGRKTFSLCAIPSYEEMG